MTLGIVLSGGGARGAYEVGVLSYILEELPRSMGVVPRYDILCATSVGAVNAAYLAGIAHDPPAGIQGLADTWTRLELEDVVRFGFFQIAGLHRVVLGGARARGLFDAKPLAQLVGKAVDWERVHQNLAESAVRALTVTATHVATGRPVVFVDRCPGTALPRGLPPNVVVRGERIHPEHVLASASIPLLFPPIRIRAHLYCDGGLRLNTPMAPAVHLGADRLLVIGVSSPGERGPTPSVRPGRFPGAPFLLGKVLNAFLLDHIHTDLGELDRMNRLLEDGLAVCGPDFIDQINARAMERGDSPRHLVRHLAIRPSVDLGRIAAKHLQENRTRFGRAFGATFLRLLDLGEGGDADLASYLLFDGAFAKKLIDLGRGDAAARRTDLAAFLRPS